MHQISCTCTFACQQLRCHECLRRCITVCCCVCGCMCVRVACLCGPFFMHTLLHQYLCTFTILPSALL